MICMKEKRTGSAPLPRPWLLPAGAVLMGMLAGSLSCAGWPWLRETVQGQMQGTLQAVLWPEGLLLLLLFLAGFARMGGAWALLALAGKGFLLGAEAAALAVGASGGGYLTQALLRCLPEFLTLSVMLLLARQSIQLSGRRLRLPPGKARTVRPDGPFYLTAGVALLAIVGAALLRQKLLMAELPELLPTGAGRGSQLGSIFPLWHRGQD